MTMSILKVSMMKMMKRKKGILSRSRNFTPSILVSGGEGCIILQDACMHWLALREIEGIS